MGTKTTNCDMCGSAGRLQRALVEGTEMDVCEGCAKFGKVLRRPITFVNKGKETKKIIAKPEKVTIIVSGFGNKVKKARERLGLTQEEFSKKVAEKESLIQQIETEKIKPKIETARKIERALDIHLVEEYEEEGSSFSVPQKTKEFTIGDMIKVRK